MLWSIHHWFFLYCTSIFVLEDCQSLFLRHVKSGKCITTGKLVYDDSHYAVPYYAVMTNNCLEANATFRYLDTELLQHIRSEGTFASSTHNNYRKDGVFRLFIYKGMRPASLKFQNKLDHRLQQTPAGSLRFYNMRVKVCAEPSGTFVNRKTTCGVPAQNFTFGAVTQYNSQMIHVHCSPKQRMVIHRADYGDFNKTNTFDIKADTDQKCSVLTNCQVKSQCGGNKSCELTMDNNILPLHYCPHVSKQIYTEYTCVDNHNSQRMKGSNVRLSKSPNVGFIEIKDGPIWRKINEENWDKDRQTMLCQHLGFEENADNNIANNSIATGEQIATGHLICYKTQSNREISCCIYLEPLTTTSETTIPYITCGKICDKPLLENVTMFPDAVFSGSDGSSDYHQGRFYGDGWCSSGSGTEYLSIDLQNNYHITRVVIMGDKNQTKWSNSYSLKYSHIKTLVDGSTAVNLTGNKNGYQASTTLVDIYNVRYIKIQSFENTNFCLRIELCGEVQLTAPVKNLMTKPSNFSVNLTWTIPHTKLSRYITFFIIYLNSTQSDGTRIVKIPRVKFGNEFVLRGLKPYTEYTVGIQAQDSFLKNATIVYQSFMTEEAVPSGPPMNVTVNSRSSNSLGISWKAPDENLKNGKLTGYQVCHSSSVIDENQECFDIESSVLSYNIPKLQPSTKYFVTVAARTKIGYGNKSLAISKITNGEPPYPIAISNSSLNVTLVKQATYIKAVMVIVQVAPKTPTSVEDIQTNELKPYQTNTQNPYITAYFKANILPLTFVIGDGKEYKFENKKYFNHPLKHSSSYIVFLRFFETKNSYYSTEWSSSVETMIKPPGHSGPPLDVILKSRGKTSLDVSWKVPDENLQNSELTGYQVCFYTRDTTPECLVVKSIKVLSLTLNNLQPSTKYFVTVSAITKAGYGEKSLEVSKITNGEAINPLTMSYYTLSLDIPKQKDYIREVMVIVENSIRSSARSENLRTSDLKPYQRNIKGPYVTAYIKADVLPLTFVIGDGREYNSEDEKYFNQPLKQNSKYIVFLRFFENQNSFYSTEWSGNVTTMMKPPVESENAKQSNREEIQIDFIIPLVISVACFLLSLGVNIYQRRLIQSNNGQQCHTYKTSKQAQQMTKFDSLSNNERTKDISMKASPKDQSNVTNDEGVYELPDSVMEFAERNQAELGISTGQESSTYMSLKDNKEPGNLYQSLQPKKDNIAAVEYENPAFNFSDK